MPSDGRQQTGAFTHVTVDRINQGDVAPLAVLAERPELLGDAAPTVRHQLYSLCLTIVADSRGVLSSGSGVKPESARALRSLSALLRSSTEAGSELRALLRSSGVEEIRRLRLQRHVTSQKEDVRPAALEFCVYVTELLRVRTGDILVDTASGSIATAVEAQRQHMQAQQTADQRTAARQAAAADQQDDTAARHAARGSAIQGQQRAAARASSATAGSRSRTGLTLPSRPSTRPPATNPLFAAPTAAGAAGDGGGRRGGPEAGEAHPDLEVATSGGDLQPPSAEGGAADDGGTTEPPVPELQTMISPSAVTFFAKHFGLGCVPVLPSADQLDEHQRFVFAAVQQQQTDGRSGASAAVAIATGDGSAVPTSDRQQQQQGGVPRALPVRTDASYSSYIVGLLVNHGEAVGWGTARWGELGPAAQAVAAHSVNGAVSPTLLRLHFPVPSSAAATPSTANDDETAAPAGGSTGSSSSTPVPPVPICAALGQHFTAWLLLNGTITTHGNGEWGQLGLGPAPQQQPPGTTTSSSSFSPTQGLPSGGTAAAEQSGSGRTPAATPPPGASSAAAPVPFSVNKPRLVVRTSRSADPYVRVFAGFAYTAALTGRGDVCLWGNNNHGQCSVGVPVAEGNMRVFNPMKVSLKNTPLIDLAAGSFFVVALTATRSVLTWGIVSMLGIGDEDAALDAIPTARRGTSASRSAKAITTTPVRVTALDKKSIFMVAAGQWHVAAVSTTGALYTWGVGHQGRLGHGDAESRAYPTLVEGLRGHGVVRVACGSFHTVALTSTGVLFAFGDNAAGQCGVVGATCATSPQRVALPPHVVVIDIACGREHTIAITSDGDVWSFGTGPAIGAAERRLTSYVPRPVLNRRCTVSLACGVSHTVALTVARSLITVSLGELGSAPTRGVEEKIARVLHSSGLEGVALASMAAGSGFMILADEVGAVRSIGSGDWGQLGRPADQQPSGSPTSPQQADPTRPGLVTSNLPRNAPIVHVAAGFAFAFSVASNGQVYSWGNNNHGQCGHPTATPKLTKPTLVPALSYSLGGAAAAAGAASSPSSPAELAGAATIPAAVKAPVAQIACGSFFAIALTHDGLVYAWGHPDCCGLTSEEFADSRAVVDAANRQAAEAAATMHGSAAPGGAAAGGAATETPGTSPARSGRDGGGASSGAFDAAAVGEPPVLAAAQVIGMSHSAEPRPVLIRPTRVTSLTNITAIAAGQWHAAALDAAGNVHTWGLGQQGRLGHGDQNPRPVPARVVVPGGASSPFVRVVCGSFNTAAVTAGGALFVWGDNEQGQCGVDTPLVATDRPTMMREGGVIDVALGRHHVAVIDDKRECLVAGRLPMPGGSTNPAAGSGGQAAAAAPALQSPRLVPLRTLIEQHPAVTQAYTTAVQQAIEGLPMLPALEEARRQGLTHSTPKVISVVCGANHVALTLEVYRPKPVTVHAGVKELRKLASVTASPSSSSGNAEGRSGRPRSRTTAAVGGQDAAQRQPRHADAFADL